MFANDSDNYGWFSIALHWSMAVIIIGLFWLGLSMVELDYYDPWYNRAPAIHESVGLLLAAMLLLRLLARLLNPPPPPLASLHSAERGLAITVHWLFYALILATITSGYFISTAGGTAVSLFDWFELPAALGDYPQQEDIAGLWHERLAWSLVVLAALHGLASIKHHFIDRDRSLRRILGL